MRPNHAMMCRRWRSARTSQLQMSSPTLYNARREKLLRLAYWLIPAAFCLVIYYWGLRAWYQQDDFLWLGQRFRIGTWHDFLRAVFGPAANGTFRPFSERLFLLAASMSGTKFKTFDLKTQKWTELITGNFVNYNLSPDRKYFVFTTGGTDPEVRRLRFSDGKIETIASRKKIPR